MGRIRREALLIAYSSGNFGKNIVWSGADLTLLFLLINLFDVPPGLAGTLLLLAMAADIVIDLAAGRLNAGARKLGIRYATLMLASAPVCAAAFALLYALPAIGEASLPAVVALLFLFRIGYGLVDVPHNAMLPGVTRGMPARSRVAGYRFFFSSLATLMVAMWVVPGIADARSGAGTTGLAWFGLGAGVALMIAAGLVFVADRWRAAPSTVAVLRTAFFPHFELRYVALLGIAALTGAALPMFTRTMLFYADTALGEPHRAQTLLTTIVVGQFAGAAFWPMLAQKRSANAVLGIAHLCAAATIAIFALSPRDALQPASLLVGFALSGAFLLPWALLASVIDRHGRIYGEPREAQCVALFLVVLKIGAAFSAFASGWALEAAGYAGSAPSRDAAALITWLMLAPPIGGALLCAALTRALDPSSDRPRS